jgi:N-formylglutamate amidohydrolase
MSAAEPIRSAEAGAPAMSEPPYLLREPQGRLTPLVFASPHSGRLYPEDLMAASGLGPQAIRRSEDAFVDRLIESAPSVGVTAISARFARAYVDVNREAWELDPQMFEDELPAYARAQTARISAGLGSIARVVGEGQEIYRRKLTFSEARERIEGVHRPYHAALEGRLQAVKSRFGVAVLVDWHSMPSAATRSEARRGRPRPDMVLGDRHGASCGRPLTALVRRELQAAGYVVALNSPYAGGYTTQHYGHPSQGVHALQVEIDRSLYLDEASLEPTGGFEPLKLTLNQLFDRMAAQDWRSLL